MARALQEAATDWERETARQLREQAAERDRRQAEAQLDETRSAIGGSSWSAHMAGVGTAPVSCQLSAQPLTSAL